MVEALDDRPNKVGPRTVIVFSRIFSFHLESYIGVGGPAVS